MRTGERMSFTTPTQTTPRAVFARVGRVHTGKSHTVLLRLRERAITDKPTLPERESASMCLSPDLALFGLRDVQVFKDEHRVSRSPCDKLISCLLGQGTGTVALLAPQLFQNTPNTSCILVFCLTGCKLALEARSRLSCTSVLDLLCVYISP